MQHWAKLREVLRAVLVPKRNEEWYTCCQKKIERNSSLYSADHTWLRNTEMHFPYAVWFLSSDEDECLKTPPVCDVNANCNNTLGSYLCFCKEGFMGDGKTCQGKLKWWSGKNWLNENVSEKYDLFITIIRNVCWVCRNEQWYHLFVLCCFVFNKLNWPISRLVRLRLSRAAHSVSTHLCVVCLHFCCPMSLFQGHFTSVSKFSQTAPEESGSKQV